jgi:uncharacterized protein (DUF2336 family)
MSAFHHSIQGLVELARQNAGDIRPMLLRVLADLYVQEPSHPPSGQARFAELACRLLDGVDAATRAAVATRLASYPGTPAVVTSQLARDEIRVADPVLRRSLVLGESELHAILDRCGIAHAIAIAARKNLPASVAKRLRKTAVEEPAAAPASEVAPALERSAALTHLLARRFFRANSIERKRIVTAMLACPAVQHEERLRRLDRRIGERLETAALRHRSQEFAGLLRQAIGLPAAIVERVLTDPSGDPLVALCRALELPFNRTSRIVLFLNPQIGASVQQVFALAGGFEDIAPAAARRLVAAWCEIVSADQPARALSTARPARDVRAAAAPRILRAATPARPARPASARDG